MGRPFDVPCVELLLVSYVEDHGPGIEQIARFRWRNFLDSLPRLIGKADESFRMLFHDFDSLR
jgi:hypothetical protein